MGEVTWEKERATERDWIACWRCRLLQNVNKRLTNKIKDIIQQNHIFNTFPYFGGAGGDFEMFISGKMSKVNICTMVKTKQKRENKVFLKENKEKTCKGSPTNCGENG